MLIWALMGIGLIVIVAGGFAERSRRSRRAEQESRNATHKKSHHGKAAHNSRGRGRGH
jgi:hypothetical protein